MAGGQAESSQADRVIMAKIAFTSHLERYVEQATVETEGETVGVALERVFAVNPKLRGYVVDEVGALRKHISVFLDNEPIKDRVHLSDPLRQDSQVFVLQALSGG